MQFSDTALKQGLVEDIDYLCKTDATSYPLADKARNVNNAVDRVVGIIMSSDNRWQWDDTNNAAAPIGTINLVEGTDNYAIKDITYLKILRVEVLDVNGKYQLVKPIDKRDVQNQSMTEFLSTDGMPQYYDKLGNFMFLYPTPSASLVTLANGLKIYYQRDASAFVAGDTAKVPGFAKPFHKILSLDAALDYADVNEFSANKIARWEKKKAELETLMIEFYQTRDRDDRPRMTVRRENYGIGLNDLNELHNHDLRVY